MIEKNKQGLFLNDIGNFFLQLLNDIGNFFLQLLQNLDPSLFQNIIIGILMLLIFIGQLIFSDVKNQEKKGEFSKMVIFYEILDITKITLFSIGFLLFITFFKDGGDCQNIYIIGNKTKLFLIITLAFVLYILIKPLTKIQEYFSGKRYKYEIAYLKSLKFSKKCSTKNQIKEEIIIRAWKSFWSEKSEYNEIEFTEIYIYHIENSIKKRRFKVTIDLAQIYINNINNRDCHIIGNYILPKIFEWNILLWNNSKNSLNKYHKDLKIKKTIPTFRSRKIHLFKNDYSEGDSFPNWQYFRVIFFTNTIKKLINNEDGQYLLIEKFKEHIDECYKKLGKMKNIEEKNELGNYIIKLLHTFSFTLFDEINYEQNNGNFWKDWFPQEWIITFTNKDNWISKVIFHAFLEWSRKFLFNYKEIEHYNNQLSYTINGLFPNVDHSLFTSFLKLYSSFSVKEALDKIPNFYLINESVFTGSFGETMEERNNRNNEMIEINNNSRKNETILLIIDYFGFNWINNFNLYQDKNIKFEGQTEINIKLAKLKQIKLEFESQETKDYCINSKEKEFYRNDILELLDLLITELNNKNNI